MCTVFGSFGYEKASATVHLQRMRRLARQRGRDTNCVEPFSQFGCHGFIGHARAVPTNEIAESDYTLYPDMEHQGWIVSHNGTIHNDKEIAGELAQKKGWVDSMILPKLLVDAAEPEVMVEYLNKVKGSYAFAAVNPNQQRLILARNYLPLFYVLKNGMMYYASMPSMLEFLDAKINEVPPYHLMQFTVNRLNINKAVYRITDFGEDKVLVVCSGGMDSTTALAQLLSSGTSCDLLHFQYKCRAENREIEMVMKLAEHYKIKAHFLPLPFDKIGGSNLTDGNRETKFSQGTDSTEFAYEWVPTRNLVFASLAVAFAEAHGYNYVALGNNLEEAGAYPDNEPQMYVELNKVLTYATAVNKRIQVIQPVGQLMKHEIVKLAHELNVPLELTWSCYEDGDKPCGKCGSCTLRKVAHERNGLTDKLADITKPTTKEA